MFFTSGMLPYLFLAEVHYFCVIFLSRWNAYSMVLGWDIEVMYVKEIAGSEKYLWLCSMKECQIFYIKWDLHFNQTFYFSNLHWNESKWFCSEKNFVEIVHLNISKGSVWCMLKYTLWCLNFPTRNAITNWKRPGGNRYPIWDIIYGTQE